MKSIIRNILLEEVEKKSRYLKINDSRLGKVILQEIENYDDGDDYYEIEGLFTDISEKYAIEKEYVKFIYFKNLIDQGNDPEKESYLSDWLYKVSDVMSFLIDSGYYNKFINLTHFNDIWKIGDDKYVFIVDSWYDFSYLFDDPYIPEQVLSEDWAEIFDTWYGTDLDEIFNSLNDKGIRVIQDFIIENVSHIVDIGHREEFNEHGMGITGAVGSDEEGVIDVQSNVENIRQITDNYNLLLLVDEGDFPEKDELISNLKSAYNNSYNGAAEDELFEQIKSQIEDFLGSEGNWEGKVLHFPVSQEMKDLVDKYVEELNMNPISEHGDFLHMITWMAENHDTALDSPNMDYYYPDHTKVESWFNEVLGDYVYL
jgi:hypothetical protein